jgi:hypothetical protein
MLAISLALCAFIVYAADSWDTAGITQYQKKLFGDEILSIDIQANAQDWQGMLENAQAKEWISADLVINGARFSTVGIRTKGNSSLSMGARSASSESARYSLQFKFNKYVKGQTCYGLDAFCINNMMGDATYMKDYLSYEIMDYIGVDTPLKNYAEVTVNGEGYGFFVALERYDEAFMDRVYNTSGGELYSVKISMGMRGDFEDMRQDGDAAVPAQPDGAQGGTAEDAGGARPGFPQGGFPGFEEGETPDFGGEFPGFEEGERPEFGGGFPGYGGEASLPERPIGGGMGGAAGFGGNGGGSLIYTDDEISSYSSIFDNAVSASTNDADKQRVITAIKNLNAGTELEKYFDVDGILRYFAAHTAVVNLDSYVSNMQQNYYIYEHNGRLTILPWDYGLAFGGYMSQSATSVVNFPIDTPVSGVSMEDRPLLNKLLEVAEYRERYHGYLLQIAQGYFESGLFAQTVAALDAKIGAHVETDVSAYYTHEQYTAALAALIGLGALRAESIMWQLDGTIPSTTDGQSADSSALVDASGLDLSALGSMMGGGGMGEWQGGRGGRGEMPAAPENWGQPSENQEDAESPGAGSPSG